MASFDRADEAAWSRVAPLSALLAAGQGRPSDADLTMFKAMGMGISDLALGIEIYRIAAVRSLGKTLPIPQRATPRLKPADCACARCSGVRASASSCCAPLRPIAACCTWLPYA